MNERMKVDGTLVRYAAWIGLVVGLALIITGRLGITATNLDGLMFVFIGLLGFAIFDSLKLLRCRIPEPQTLGERVGNESE